MQRKPPGYQDDEPPTQRNPKPSKRTDADYTVGQLMVESLNHRRRIEVLEERLEILESEKKNTSIAPHGSDSSPPGRQRLFALVRKTVTTTVVIIAALISALKELGFLK
jgi:hypothetical protein